MLIEESTFDGDGRRLLIRPGADLASIEPPFSELLTNEECEALRDHHDYFERLATNCEIKHMREWLNTLARADDLEVEINIRPMFGAAAVTRICGFDIALKHAGIEIPEQTPQLRILYSSITGNWETRFTEAGGLHEPMPNNTWWASDDPRVRDAISFYTNPFGDHLVAIGDEVYSCPHDAGLSRRKENVQDILDVYFSHLMNHTEHNFH